MNRNPNLTNRHQGAILTLLSLAALAPLILRAGSMPSWLPDWSGAAVAVAALFGALLVFWRAGALRVAYLVLFVTALVAALMFGRLISHA